MNEHQNTISISFIIPVLNGEKYVSSCLTSITRQMETTDELIIIDNGSTDNTLELISKYDKVAIIQSDAPTIATLRNLGAEQAIGDTLAFIDIDCVISSSWRQAVEKVLSDKSIDATGSLYDLPENRSWIEAAWWSSNPLEAGKASYMVGGNFVIRKEIFHALNGFDPKLITDEDSDIGERLNRQGYVLIDDPEVAAVHLGNPKNLREFIKKEKWHSASILDTMVKHGIDKPMLMTFAFMFFSLLSILAVICGLFSEPRALLLLPIVLIVPLATSAYRVLQSSHIRFFLPLTVLYFIFYSVRSITVVESLLNRLLAKEQIDG